MAATLRDLQCWLAGLVLDPGRLEANGVVEARRHLDYTDDATIETRLAAYVEGYPARLEEALVDTFPATRHLVGVREFRALVERYRPDVPDGGYDLAAVGQALPAFLVQDTLTDALPFLPDLTRLEWSVHEAFHARLAPPYEPATGARAALEDWERAILELQPGVGVIESRWPIRELWMTRNTPRDEIDIAVAHRPQCVLVYRSGFRVAAETITIAEARCLARVLGGSPLGDVLSDPDEAVAAATIGQWTAGWMRRGLVAGVRIGAEVTANDPRAVRHAADR